MSKRTSPEWMLDDTWAVSRDSLNWILQKRNGARWRTVGYYPTPELLLKSLYRKLARTELVKPDLIQHLETCLEVALGCSERFAEHIHTHLGLVAKLTPHAAATLEQRDGRTGTNDFARTA